LKRPGKIIVPPVVGVYERVLGTLGAELDRLDDRVRALENERKPKVHTHKKPKGA
jgi:hypothetical protein